MSKRRIAVVTAIAAAPPQKSHWVVAVSPAAHRQVLVRPPCPILQSFELLTEVIPENVSRYGHPAASILVWRCSCLVGA